ncbi:MAG: sugar phosphate isomerase/epimerase [Sulfuritalea sp.]|nr:sugar phosphate isomerase/epimerase [Sulfuritalea sp.]
MNKRIGFMQGRLSPLVDGRIQAFPWTAWKAEFPIAEHNNFRLMEWTLDQNRLYENPLLDPDGQAEIQNLCRRHGIAIPSLTGDCFMQAPFWKADATQGKALKDDFVAIANACATVGISMIVVPLVDNGRLDTRVQEDALVEFLQAQSPFLAAKGLRVIFESDFAPEELARFIDRLAPGLFGINYDIGNSAALGFRPQEEFAAYGPRIVNVHVKDRVLGGTTVPLGTGNADFDTVFAALAKARYQGNFILQTARAQGEGHAETLSIYRDMVLAWMQQSGLP